MFKGVKDGRIYVKKVKKLKIYWYQSIDMLDQSIGPLKFREKSGRTSIQSIGPEQQSIGSPVFTLK